MVYSWRCRIWVDILRCFAGGWPRAFCSSVVDAAAAFCCSDSMAHHTDGWLYVVAYLGGGPRCDGPPFGPTTKIFYRRLYMKKCVFSPFSSKNCKIQQCLMVFCVSKFQKKWANLRFPLNIQKQKVFQLQGGFALDQGLCPWTPLGAPPPDPRYRLALHALTMAPFCQILNTPLVVRPTNAAKPPFHA